MATSEKSPDESILRNNITDLTAVPQLSDHHPLIHNQIKDNRSCVVREMAVKAVMQNAKKTKDGFQKVRI
jgi:hypothetical protein